MTSDKQILCGIVPTELPQVDPGAGTNGGTAEKRKAFEGLVLWQDCLNLFNLTTTIKQTTLSAGHVTVWIFDVRGHKVEILLNGC